MQRGAFFWIKLHMKEVYRKDGCSARVLGKRQWVSLNFDPYSHD